MDNASRELFAWVANDPDGVEGIVMVPDSQGNPMPLVTATRRVADIGRSFIVEHGAAQHRGATVRLVRYEAVEILDSVEP